MKMMFPRLFLLIIMGSIIAGCAMGAASQKQASYHYQMGLSYLGERNYTSALIELTEAEKSDPENPELLYNLGLAYAKSGDKVHALEECRSLERLEPELASRLRNLIGGSDTVH